MKLKCLQCGHEFEGIVSKDELGWHSSCPKYGGSFDATLPDSITYGDLCEIYHYYEKEHPHEPPLTGFILITQSSFTKEYTEAERTYSFSSRNKAFMPNMGRHSIFADSLGGSDRRV